MDIVEGINLFTHNALSAHTKSGFWMKTVGFASKFMLSGSTRSNCDADATNDQGQLFWFFLFETMFCFVLMISKSILID